MKLRRNFGLSRKALLRHRVRTLLAISGTTIGVAAVLVMVAVGEGAERAVLEQVEALGRNVLVVSAGTTDRLVGRTNRRGPATTLRPEDAEAILAESPLVRLAAPARDGMTRVKFGDIATGTNVRGTTPDFEEIRSFRTSRGRYFTDEENRTSQRVAVLGWRVADDLFGDRDPVGETVRVGRVPLEVIGVLEAKGTSVDGSADEDNLTLIPLRTAMRRVFNTPYLSLIYLQIRDGSEMEAAHSEVSELLRRRHRLDRLGKPDDFRIQNQAVIVEAEMAATSAFQRLITALGAVSLVVGGVGILSIMLLSVRERRNEVGLRVAVGARRRDVRTQFLVEAMFLGVAGGLAGLAIGLLASLAIGQGTEWRTAVSPEAVGLALGSALTVAVLFGVYPALRAAALDPIESLRAE